MLSGFPPFDGDSEKEIYDAIEEGEYDYDDAIWDDITDEAKMFISKLLCDEKHRMTAKKALKHPWIKKTIEKGEDKVLSHAHLTRLKNFNSKKKLRQAVLTFMASRVTDEEIEEQTKLFRDIDHNNDGYITLKELTKVLEGEYDISVIKEIMNSVDTDKNGAINFNEFIAATLEPKITQDIKRVEQAFKFFDTDNDGYIDGRELKELLTDKSLQPMQTIHFQNILEEADEDGNGKIDIKEFMRLMSIRPPAK
jgi:calcium-dependent protein kinase